MGTPIRHLTEDTSPAAGDMLVVDKAAVQTTRKWTLATLVSYLQATLVFGGGSGEVNTASNVGTSGVGVYDSKSGVDLRFRKINGASSKLIATLNSQQIDLDVPDASTSQKGAVQLAGIDGTDATAGKAVQASDARLAIDAVAATGSLRTLGTGAQQAAAGNHTQDIAHGGTGTGSTLAGLVRGSGSAMTAAELSGDATTSGSNVVNVGKVNGVSLAGLATGILKNTTTTGAPSIAVAGDFPALNQNTSGTAADLSATLIVGHGGTGASTLAAHGVVIGNGASAVNVTGAGAAGQVLKSNGAGADPTWQPASVAQATFKQAAETVTSSTTLQTDDYLVAVLGAGTFKIQIELWLTADTARGIRWDKSTTGTVANSRWHFDVWDQDGSPALSGQTFGSSGFAGFTSAFIRITGTITMSTSGTLALQWAQAVSGGTPTIVEYGSSLVVTPLA